MICKATKSLKFQSIFNENKKNVLYTSCNLKILFTVFLKEK